jgi:arylsulfatase A-like enzyme
MMSKLIFKSLLGNRRPSWVSLILLVILGSACQPEKKQPNFLLIVADDLGYTDLGSFGSSFYETPNLDALAGNGIRFTNGYASCPVCSPTRASIQTGKYPVRSGITDWIPGRVNYAGTTVRDRWMNLPTTNELKVEEITIADVLKENGYRTFFAGKWHLGESEGYWPENQGYDINKGGHWRGSPNSSKSEGYNGYFSPYGNPRLEDGPGGEYLPERLAEETVSFINVQNGEEPFFACLAFYLVHTPLQAKEEHIEYYKKQRAIASIDSVLEIDENPVWAEWATKSRYSERHIQGQPVYAGMVRALDENVGKVIRALKDQGLYENTVIIFTSDNGGLSTAEGWPTSNDPFRAGKGWLFEGGTRVPWIMKIPENGLKGYVEHMPISSIDIMPTMLSLAGVGSDSEMDGVDLTMYLGKKTIPDRPLFWHYPHYSNQGGNPGSVVRMGRYKLIHDFEKGSKELYDLEADIGETYDLSAENPALTDSLYHMLDSWRKSTGAVMMTTPNPEWDNAEPVVN